MQVPWDWTVGDLKNKLMREYEGRPEAEEQKLIFSGKVLQNAQVLRDVVTVPAREEGDEEKENDEEFSAKFHLVVRSIMCAPSSSNRTSRANSEASTPRAPVGSFEPEGSGLGERVSSPEAEATACAEGDIFHYICYTTSRRHKRLLQRQLKQRHKRRLLLKSYGMQ